MINPGRDPWAMRCVCPFAIVVLPGQDDDAILAAHLATMHKHGNPYALVYAHRYQAKRGPDGRIAALA